MNTPTPMPLKIEQVSPKNLTPHKALPDFGVIAEQDRVCLKLSIQRVGILEPLLATPEGLVYSGRIRWAIAIELKLPKVPVVYLPAPDLKKFFLESVAFGRARTLSVAAIFLIELHPEILEQVGKRGNPQFGKNPNCEESRTYVDWTAETGIPEKYIRHAAKIKLQQDEDWPKLCAEVMTGACVLTALSAKGGREATENGRPESMGILAYDEKHGTLLGFVRKNIDALLGNLERSQTILADPVLFPAAAHLALGVSMSRVVPFLSDEAKSVLAASLSKPAISRRKQ